VAEIELNDLDLITVPEIWLKSDQGWEFNSPGCTKFRKTDSGKRGGVALIVKDHTRTSVRTDLASKDHKVESIWVEIKNRNSLKTPGRVVYLLIDSSYTIGQGIKQDIIGACNKGSIITAPVNVH